MPDDTRLIEEYLPIGKISERAASEPRTKGHISTLHVWRARRPLVACRAAVYGSLVPAERFVPAAASEKNAQSLGRANASKVVAELCTYPGRKTSLTEARKHILEAHAARLTTELGRPVTTLDIEAGRAPRPKVLDLFAGGGAIPLEALRLGCEAHAVELNPVAHLIELCTITYPQEFGSALADDVERWGRIVLERTQRAVADLYPRITVPAVPETGHMFASAEPKRELDLSVVAFYWTRTVPCPNSACRATVPLYRQTWLRKKESGYVALRPRPDKTAKTVRFEVVQADTEEGLGFDPGEGSEGTATVCPFCQGAVSAPYVRRYGDETGFGQQLMCIIAQNPHGTGKLYFTDDRVAADEARLEAIAEERARKLEEELGDSSLDEEIPPTGNAGLATGKSYLYGIRVFRQAFTPRQRCVLLTFASETRSVWSEMREAGLEDPRARAVTTYLALWLSRMTDKVNSLARWNNGRETVESLSSMKRLAMMWDFPEVNPFGGSTGDALGSLDYMMSAVRQEATAGIPADCVRTSATELMYSDATFDAVVTDPPYYDNESYSELSDVCYIWLRLAIGTLFPEHFSTSLTPKKKECVAAAYRQGGKEAAARFFETTLLQSLNEANRVLKPDGIITLMYAHKTTSGWATLVEAVRSAGFTVTEAWPLDTETRGRVAHQGDAALASSIFLVARKRRETRSASYDGEVRPDLERIVRERVESLWDAGIGGADLVIAAVGAGLRAFTKYGRVEHANGEEVPAHRFLAEVESLVLETLLEKIFGVARAGVGQVDGASRFYVLWRHTYKAAPLEAGEAIVFTYGQPVELDGPTGLSFGARALVEKKKAAFRLRDFTERGGDDKLGLPDREGRPAPLIDTLHRILWLLENRPRVLGEYLAEAKPDAEKVRLVAEVLAGRTLKGSGEAGILEAAVTTPAEHAAIGKLLGNWRMLIEGELEAMGPLFQTRRP